MSDSIKLCEVDALGDGEIACIEFDGRAIAYARIDGTYYAIDDTCTHAHVALSEGIVDEDDCTIECPKHGALFSLATGEALTLPAIRPVLSHPVEIRESTVFITLTHDEDQD